MQIKNGCLVCCWSTCGRTFSNLQELSVHVNDDHVRVECPDMDFQCQWQGCSRRGRGFNARYKMLIHVRTHTNEKPHTCTVCNKTFSRLENLKIHTRSHTGEKPYACSFPGCAKAYSNSSDRFKHVRTHQEDKPYKCKMSGCRKQYTDPSSLRKHVRTHGHFGSTEVVLRRSFSCEPPKRKNSLKREDNYSAQLHFVDVQTEFKNEHFCELNNQNDSKNILKQIRSSIDVKYNITSSDEETRVLRTGLTDCHNSIGTICKIELGEEEVTSPPEADEIVSLDRFRLAEDRLINSSTFRFADNKVNDVNRFRNASEAHKIFWQKENINSENVSTGTRELGLAQTNKQKNDNSPNLPKSEKITPLLNYKIEKYESRPSTQEENEQNVFDYKHDSCNHSQNVVSLVSQKLEITRSSSAQSCSRKISVHNSNDVGWEIDTESRRQSSPLTLDSPRSTSKTPPIEHWKKRKIMNREKELNPFLHLPTSTTLSEQNFRFHSIPHSHTPKTFSEIPATYSPSLPPNTSSASSTPLLNTSSPPPPHLTPTPPTSTATTTTSFPPLSQHPHHLLPPLHPQPFPLATDPCLLVPCPNTLHSLLSNYYSYTQSTIDATTYPPFYIPSLTLSTCSVIPLPTAYHPNNNTDHHPHLHPTYLFPPEISISRSKLQLQEKKQIIENVTPNYLQHFHDLKRTFSPASLGQFGFWYPDYPINMFQSHQSCRTLFTS